MPARVSSIGAAAAIRGSAKIAAGARAGSVSLTPSRSSAATLDA